mgnify:CR=1 FL=1
MILISHRGNTRGPDPLVENSPSHIRSALKSGYNVEVDVWLTDGEIKLGHDNPKYKTNIEFLQNDRIWCHCKNIGALEFLINKEARCFFHHRDAATLTSDGYIWTYPGLKLTSKSICVLPERHPPQNMSDAAGVCSDFIESYK